MFYALNVKVKIGMIEIIILIGFLALAIVLIANKIKEFNERLNKLEGSRGGLR